MNFLQLKINNTIKNKSTGFTLVETLVAISILLMAVVAPLVLISGNIAVISGAKDKITALYLAEDAVDFVKYRLETNLNAQNQNGGPTPDWLWNSTTLGDIDCNYTTRCIVDSFNDTITTCTPDTNENCPVFLQIDPTSGVYGYQSGWTDTKFIRTIKLSSDSNTVPAPPDTSANHEGTSINVTVSWIDRGTPKQLKLSGYAYYWNGYLPYWLNIAP